MNKYIQLNQILHADCMDIMKDIPDKYFELAIVDPPYGINMGGNAQIMSLKSRPKWKGCKYEKKEWDNQKPNKNYFDQLFRISKNQILWGGNYFISFLVETNGWIFWYKKMRHNENFSHGELAWTSFKKSLKLFSFTATGYSKNKIHPTQKPIQLYRWILQNYAKPDDKIIDTHSGSGSLAIACHLEGFDFLAIEKDHDYWKASVERYETEISQGKLF